MLLKLYCITVCARIDARRESLNKLIVRSWQRAVPCRADAITRAAGRLREKCHLLST